MSALFRRFRDGRRDAAASDSMAMLIASLEASTSESRSISHREFRKYIQEQHESKTEAWMPIRSASRNSGYR